MKTVGVISRLTIDTTYLGLLRFPNPGEELLATACQSGLGGGSVVSAVLLNRFGAPVKFGSFRDTSELSDRAFRMLADEGLRSYKNLYHGNWSPVTQSLVFPMAGNRSIITIEDPLQYSDDEVLKFYSSCCIALVPADPIMTQKVHAVGTTTVIDPSDLSVEQVKKCLPYADFLTPNEREATRITGFPDPEAALYALLESGVQNPVIKLGESGCMIHENGTATVIPGIPAEAVDTTGAGDNFLAGFLYGISSEWSLADSVRMGNVCGSLSVRKIGALGARTTLEDAADCFKSAYGRWPNEISDY